MWGSLMKKFLPLGITSFLSQISLVMAMAAARQMGHTMILFLILSGNLTEREKELRMSVIRQLQYYSIACKVIASAKELEV